MDDYPSASTLLRDPAILVGTWRRFGLAGPVYEIVGAASRCRGATI
jgi:hypothetical protein